MRYIYNIMPPLKNTKHEIFAQAIFLGSSQADAMAKAGYTYISGKRNGGSAGSRLAHHVNIASRVTELQEASAALAVQARQERSQKVMNRDEKLERLSDIAREDVEGRYSLIREPNISAIRVLNDMTGDNAPAKVDLTAGLEELLSKLQGRKELPGGRDDD